METGPCDVPVGLCASCRHAERVRARRGAVYYLCARSRSDPRYARYPNLPVLACPGHEPNSEERLEPERR